MKFGLKNSVRAIIAWGVFFVFVLLGFVPASPAEFNKDKFRQRVNKEMQRWNVPGMAVLIIKDDKVILKEGFGYRDVKQQLKVTPKTIFAIGSCTKAFTAFSIGLLSDEKKVDLDKPVIDYFPRFKLSDPLLTQQVTVRDILCHRTGIPGFDLVWYHNDTHKGDNRDEIISKARYISPTCGIREKFQYNNIMYAVAGKVTEEITGKKWEDFVRERIFQPLGMNDSNFSYKESTKTSDFALPYDMDRTGLKELPKDPSQIYSHLPLKEIPFYYNMDCVGPSGSINSNLEDMEKWVRLYLNGGKVGDKQIISKEFLSEMLTPHISAGEQYDPASPLDPACYSLGWGVGGYRGHYMVRHAGGIDGFSSNVTLFPKERIAIVIFTNMDDTKLHHILIMDIADELMDMKKPDRWDKALENQKKELEYTLEVMAREEKKIIPGTKPSHPLQDYTGIYTHPALGHIPIKLEGDHLTFSFFKFHDQPLKHYHYDTFTTGTENPLSLFYNHVIFHTDMEGNIESLSFPLYPDIPFLTFKKEKENKGEVQK